MLTFHEYKRRWPDFPGHMLLEAFTTPGISKPALLEVIASQKQRFGVRDLLTAAYAQLDGTMPVMIRIQDRHGRCGLDLHTSYVANPRTPSLRPSRSPRNRSSFVELASEPKLHIPSA